MIPVQERGRLRRPFKLGSNPDHLYQQFGISAEKQNPALPP
jgi:hypothetical protein